VGPLWTSLLIKALRLRQPHGIIPSDAVAPVCRAT
jgi:hypothetical protein